MTGKRDRSLDTLLYLDGNRYHIHDEYWVQFRVRRVEPTEERPHGLEYALTLHGPKNERILGFDNAHPIPPTSGPSGRGRAKFDHKHRHKNIRPYVFQGAGKLIEDFWEAVDNLLSERGIQS